jgi:hypothetical protein
MAVGGNKLKQPDKQELAKSDDQRNHELLTPVDETRINVIGRPRCYRRA